MKKVLRKMPNWKTPDPDLVQGFWFKNLTSLHNRLAEHFNQCLRECNIPSWMTKGRAVLIVKVPLPFFGDTKR